MTSEGNHGETLKGLFTQVVTSHTERDFSFKSFKTAFAKVTDLAGEILAQVDENQTEKGIACQGGCSYCCHFQVRVSPLEALIILDWVSNAFTKMEIRALRQRIRHNLALTWGKTYEERSLLKELTPCIFLENNTCSIYPVRPLICRAWTSYERNRCRDAFHTGEYDAEIDSCTASHQVYLIAGQVLQDVCEQHQVQVHKAELPLALESYFVLKEPAGQWISGKALSIHEACLFMDIQIPCFLKRFSLAYHQDGTCIEYFLSSLQSHQLISTSLIISHEVCSNTIYVSKFYPEIYREACPRYMSAVCFFLMIHHSAARFGLTADSFISLETRSGVFESFYSRLKDFEFGVRFRRPSDNYNVRGVYHASDIDTSMIKPIDLTSMYADD